ncbi:MAG: S-adenosylmethionine:tRNA ribosyltransferase-isomerase, partial [Pseudomonadota bacterium]
MLKDLFTFFSVAQMEEDLKLSNYKYQLPAELMAQRPLSVRHQSRLMIYHHPSGEISHRHFIDLADFLPSDTLLVLNNTKVFPCRLLGQRSTGGHCEVFLLSLTGRQVGEHLLYPCLIKTTRPKKLGDQYHFSEGPGKRPLKAIIQERYPDGTFGVSFDDHNNLSDWLELIGKTPIPPYVRKGEGDEEDREEYQTIYAKELGSVAAPTAGFHFTDEVFDSLQKKGIDRAEVTLHVGRGTFAPVKDEDIRQHRMHQESYFIDEKNLTKIKQAKKIIPVGTTSLRTYQAMLAESDFQAGKIYQTDLF